MTQAGPSMPTSRRETWKLSLLVLLRVTLSVSLLVAAYALIPVRSAGGGSELAWLILELCVYGVIVGVQLPAIVKAKYPVLRATEALAVLGPLYLLIFARVYLANSLNDPSAFSQALDDISALYFTVTVLATAGFGDIVAQNNDMRLLVTVQMLLNLVLLGAVLKLITSAAQHGVDRRDGQPDDPDGTGD